MITNADWDVFWDGHRAHFDAIAGMELTWKRVVANVDRYGEGEVEQFEEIPLKAIVAFNDFRNWPINVSTSSGVIDQENLYVLLNMDYLEELGYVSPEENFSFDPVLDSFKFHGITYYPQGDTPVAQIYDKAGYYMVILSRKPIKTGDDAR